MIRVFKEKMRTQSRERARTHNLVPKTGKKIVIKVDRNKHSKIHRVGPGNEENTLVVLGWGVEGELGKKREKG